MFKIFKTKTFSTTYRQHKSQENIKYLTQKQPWYNRCISGECEGHQGRQVKKVNGNMALIKKKKKKKAVCISCSCLVIKSPIWYWGINKNKNLD